MTEIPDRPHDGEFHSFMNWVSKATSWIGGTNPLCVDAKRRVCRTGRDFIRARDEDTFPIRFWCDAGPLTPAQKRESIKQAKATMRLQYPWRYSR